VQAVERGGLSAQVTWKPPPVAPERYRILRADTLEEVGTAPASASSQIVSNLPPGVPVSFVIEAIVGNAAYRSAPSNAISAFGNPGGPSLSMQLVARAPASVTVRVTVNAPDNGGRPIQRYDVSVRSESSGRVDSTAGVPYGQTFDAVLACDTLADVCLQGGTVSATVTLYNEAGAGPPGTASATIDPPPQFNVFENQFVMFVSMGGKCLDRAPFLTLQDCDGSAEQSWSPRDLGDLLSEVDRSCLQHESSNIGLSSSRDGNCRSRDDPVRWVHYPLNDPLANPRHFRGEGTSRCIAVLGDVRTSGTQVNLAGCVFNDQDRWFMFKQTGLPMALTAAAPAAATATDPAAGDGNVLGISGMAVILLAPLVAGLVGRRLAPGRARAAPQGRLRHRRRGVDR